jgi:hypothetical protein
MEFAALILGIIALIFSVMALPTVFQMFWGRPCVRIEFSSFESPKKLFCELHSVPITNRFLWRLGVRRESAIVSADFTIFEDGTNRVILDTARARLFDPADSDARGSLRAALGDEPLFFVCLTHVDNNRPAVAMGSLPGQGPVSIPTGRYLVGVRVNCGGTYFSQHRLVTIGTAPVYTGWLG